MNKISKCLIFGRKKEVPMGGKFLSTIDYYSDISFYALQVGPLKFLTGIFSFRLLIEDLNMNYGMS